MRLYLKYIPMRRGLTGLEYIPNFLDEVGYTSVTWETVITDGIIQYGFLNGEGDEFSKALLGIEGRFSPLKITEKEFIGICRSLYNETTTGPDGVRVPTFISFMASFNIVIHASEIVDCVKEMKRLFFKEIIKKRIQGDNDTLSAITKSLTLFFFHYPNLTIAEKKIVDKTTEKLKMIYPKAACISDYVQFVAELEMILSGYYHCVVELEKANTVEDVLAIKYD